MSWILPDAEARSRRAAALFAVLIRRLHGRHGGVLRPGAAEDPAGAAIWDPPGSWRAGPLRTASALPGALAAVGPRIGAALPPRPCDPGHAAVPATPRDAWAEPTSPGRATAPQVHEKYRHTRAP